jgi:hypothetical protein
MQTPSTLKYTASKLIKIFIKSASQTELSISSMPVHIAYQKDGLAVLDTLVDPDWLSAINNLYPNRMFLWYYRQEWDQIICHIFESEYDYPITFSLDGKDPVSSDPIEIDFFEVNPDLASCKFVRVH